MAHSSPCRTQVLPFVLLGLHPIIKEDINATLAEQIYGTTIHLPSNLFKIWDTSVPIHTFTPKYYGIFHSSSPRNQSWGETQWLDSTPGIFRNPECNSRRKRETLHLKSIEWMRSHLKTPNSGGVASYFTNGIF
ncbi:hypothetical protein TNCV_3829661 [Trichonephila clavipes]|nr:hypothetical protein TNCV_3829661 [Trichonephila clavipes]